MAVLAHLAVGFLAAGLAAMFYLLCQATPWPMGPVYVAMGLLGTSVALTAAHLALELGAL